METKMEDQTFCSKVLQTSSVFIYIYDLVNNENIYVNDEVKKFLGYSQEDIWEFKDKLYTIMLHPDDVEKAIKYNEVLKTFTNGERIKINFRIKNSGGEYCHFSGYEAVFKRDPKTGTPIQKIGNVIDITEQVTREKEFKAIIDTSPFHYFILDYRGTYLKAYPETSWHTFHLRETDYINKTIEEVWGDQCPELVDSFYTKLPEIIRSDFDKDFSITYNMLNPNDNKEYLFEAIVTKIDDERLLATVRDITDTRKLLEMEIGINSLKIELNRLTDSRPEPLDSNS